MRVHFFSYTQCQIPNCYTYRLFYASAAQGELPEGQEKVLRSIPMPRNSFIGADSQFLRVEPSAFAYFHAVSGSPFLGSGAVLLRLRGYISPLLAPHTPLSLLTLPLPKQAHLLVCLFSVYYSLSILRPAVSYHRISRSDIVLAAMMASQQTSGAAHSALSHPTATFVV